MKTILVFLVGVGICMGVSSTPSSTYTFFLSSTTDCKTPSLTGTTICALNNITAAIDASGTDLRAVWDSILTNVGSGGLFYFKNGTYNCNSLDQESTGGFSNYYCIGIPGNSSTNQYVTWRIEGEAATPIEDNSPLQTGGTTISLTSTAVSSVTAGSKIMQIWVRPSTGSAPTGPNIYLENFDLRVPTNQRGCETQSDLSNSLNSSYVNITADTAIQPSSLAFPVEATCSSWGGSDPGGLIQIVTNNSSQQLAYMNNVNAWGGDIGFDIRSEHSVMINAGAATCNYGFVYGARGGNLYHPSTFSTGGWSECARGLTIGANVQNGAVLDLLSLDIEEAASGSFVPVYRALETNAGNLYGIITFSVVKAGVGNVVLSVPSLFDGGGGSNMAQLSRGLGATISFPIQVSDPFTRGNVSGSLGTSSYVADSTLQISSNAAALNSGANSGRAVYKGSTFTSDMYSRISVASMDTASSTYASAEVNAQGAVGSSHQEYEFSCSRSAGAGQYGLFKHVSGIETTLVSSSTAVCPAPPFTMEIRSANGVICAYLNGNLDTNINPSCVKDSSLSGGWPSFYMAQDATSGISVSNFSAGNLPGLHDGDSVYGQPGTFTSVQQFIGGMGAKVYTVSTLPSASSLPPGTQFGVSDATTFTVGTCTGGGSDFMIAITNGSSWSCH